jgi:hypothetical protein
MLSVEHFKASTQYGDPKATLAAFIKENSTLVTSFAAFVALTAFSLQLDVSDTKIFLPALTFVGALLLGFELMMQIPPPPHQWRLALFDRIFTPLLLFMAWYWVEKFPTVWGTFLWSVICVVLVTVVPALLAHLVTKAVEFIAACLHRNIQPKTMNRIGLFVFLTLEFVLVAGTIWIFRRLAGHQFKIQLPF